MGPKNPVRFLEAFVTNLDLHALGFAKAQVAATGRPPYDPGALLELYLYGTSMASGPAGCWRPNAIGMWR